MPAVLLLPAVLGRSGAAALLYSSKPLPHAAKLIGSGFVNEPATEPTSFVHHHDEGSFANVRQIVVHDTFECGA